MKQLSIDKLNPNITLYFSLVYLYIISILKIKLEKKFKKRSDFQTKNSWLVGCWCQLQCSFICTA